MLADFNKPVVQLLVSFSSMSHAHTGTLTPSRSDAMLQVLQVAR